MCGQGSASGLSTMLCLVLAEVLCHPGVLWLKFACWMASQGFHG
jgi:hypothetical protein